MKTSLRWIFCALAVASAATANPPEDTAMTVEQYKQALVIQQFRKFWHNDPTRVDQNRYLGISTLQNPLDVWLTQEIIFEVKPQLIVETGTYRGGSALLWATLLAPIDPEATVLTIDWKDLRDPKAVSHPLFGSHVTFVEGSSIAPAVVQKVAKRAKGLRTLFILDSDHSEHHVLEELRAYAPLVSLGSYLIVQDTVLGGHAAVERFLAEDDRFEIDTTRERFVLSNNLNGFLRRVK